MILDKLILVAIGQLYVQEDVADSIRETEEVWFGNSVKCRKMYVIDIPLPDCTLAALLFDPLSLGAAPSLLRRLIRML